MFHIEGMTGNFLLDNIALPRLWGGCPRRSFRVGRLPAGPGRVRPLGAFMIFVRTRTQRLTRADGGGATEPN
jgi:hypothetical protein